MKNTRPRTAKMLRLIDAQVEKLKAGLPAQTDHQLPMVALAIAHINGQIAALEELRSVITGEREAFSE